MGTGRRLVAALLALGLAAAAQAQQAQMRIQYAEPVEIAATPGTSHFEAYGRRFDVALENNDRLFKALPRLRKAELERAKPLRGKLDGVAHSWVRLTRVGLGLEGAIWDGRDLYVVTSLGQIAANLTTPIIASPGQTVVYRLSDTLDGLPPAFCGLDETAEAAAPHSRVTGLQKYQALVTQLATAAPPQEQLDIALVADTAFQQQFGTSARDAMVARVNTVDGIFVEQVGVFLSPTEFRLVPANEDPFTATVAGQLLGQLADQREQTPALRTPGLAHLMTGKDLDGDTVGIAYIDALCEPRFGASLSDSELGSFTSALVMAHELGHNFGARHDGAAGGSCESTGFGYLMWPSINGSSTFSQCSRNVMSQTVARARGVCITSASYADVSAQAPGFIETDANAEFTLPVTVRSTGNLAVQNATLELTLNTDLSFRGADLSDGTCSAAANKVTCTLGDLAAGEQRVVGIRLFSSQLNGVSVNTVVDATNDYLPGNDTTHTNIGFRSAVDLAVSMSVTPPSGYANDPIDITLDVSSLRTQAARGGRLNLVVNFLTVDSVTAGAHACTFTSSDVRCDLADIASGATTRIVVRVHGASAGTGYISSNVQVAGDGDSSNNFASGQIVLIRERELNITASQDSMSFETGTVQEITYTLTAGGRLPIDEAEFWGQAPWNGQLDSVVPSSGTCPTLNPAVMICRLGPMNPGEVRTVVMRFHTTSSGTSAVQGQSYFTENVHNAIIKTAYTQLYSNLLIDVAASFVPYGASEDLPSRGFASVQSVGVQPAQNVVATLEFPASMQLTAISVANVSGWSCVMQTQQRAQCSGSFTGRNGASIDYRYLASEPGDFFISLSITADGDLNADNDTSYAQVRVEPYQDVGVTTSETRLNLVAGQQQVAGFTVTNAYRAMALVYLQADDGPGYDIVAMSAVGGTCQVDFGGTGRCQLAGLGPNAIVPVTITYTTSVDDQHGTVILRAFAAGRDDNSSNNNASIPFDTVAFTDVRMQAAQATATAVNGSSLRFPLVTVSNGSFTARDVVVQIPLPSFVTVQSVSASATCSGTSTLVCNFGSVSANDTRTLDLTLATTGTGNFTSDVSVQSPNDSTGANNLVSVQLSVTAPAAPPPPPPSPPGNPPGNGGGGGGGRIEWLAIALLSLVTLRRIPKRRAH